MRASLLYAAIVAIACLCTMVGVTIAVGTFHNLDAAAIVVLIGITTTTSLGFVGE